MTTRVHFRPWAPRLTALLLGLSMGLAQAADITVSAAASLGSALRELTPFFEAAHPGERLRLNFGASGALLQQIARGAPADAYVSADLETMDQAQAQGLVRAAERRLVVSNRLVLVVPRGAPAPAALADLARPAFARIAVGLPASVPAGRYAQDALEAAGLWSAVAPKVIGAQNVRQALDYAARREVDAAFVYATDAALVPEQVSVALTVPTNRPIVYPAAPLPGGPNAAGGARFVAFLLTPQAQAVWARHGFGRP